MSQQTIRIAPQPGPQTAFLSTPADIAIYGGAGGGGKTFGLLLDPLRHLHNSLMLAMTFRRTTKQVRNPGSIWDASKKLYTMVGGQPLEGSLTVKFPSGFKCTYNHIEYEKNVLDYQGTEIPWIGFDELTHFTQYQFLYMLSRNRSMSGVPGCIRATTNPDADSWVRKFIDWWIDNDSGFPIKERSGKVRYFVNLNNEFIWSDKKEELRQRFPEIPPKSVTFIPAKLSDNKILEASDPGYRANLLALPMVERQKLLEGNWNARARAGTVFQRGWFEIVPESPKEGNVIRYWDRAATKPTPENPDPDWTRGVKLRRNPNGLWFVEHVTGAQESPFEVENLIRFTALQDGKGCSVGIEVDPGSAGKSEALYYTRLLSGYNVKLNPAREDKLTRALPVSAQGEAKNIKLVAGAWNESFLSELENFPDGPHDDQVDALSGAFKVLFGGLTGTFSKEHNSEKKSTHAPSIRGGDQW